MTTPSSALVPIGQLQRIALATEAGDIPKLQGIRAELKGLAQYARSRGASIEQENAIAEAILRDERGIGRALITLKEDGLMYGGQGSVTVREGRSISAHQAEVRLDDIGVDRHDAPMFQLLASLSDDKFESLLASALGAGKRVSKVNFYAAAKAPRVEGEYEREVAKEARIEPGFATLRQGIYQLLAWHVDAESGVGGPTDNMIMRMPTNEVTELAGLIRHLVAAYQAARAARA